MIDGLTFLLVGLSIAVLIYSGWWTDRRYARFDQIPAHYNLRGEATRLTSRSQMAWALPVGFSMMIFGFTAIFGLMPAEYQDDDPNAVLVFVCIILLGAQGLTLWLLGRWARGIG